jgi:hypothetical protein
LFLSDRFQLLLAMPEHATVTAKCQAARLANQNHDKDHAKKMTFVILPFVRDAL